MRYYWGQAASGSAFGADGAITKLDNAYLNFNFEAGYLALKLDTSESVWGLPIGKKNQFRWCNANEPVFPLAIRNTALKFEAPITGSFAPGLLPFQGLPF